MTSHLPANAAIARMALGLCLFCAAPPPPPVVSLG